MPSSASGTTTRLHHGIASRLASGPTAEAWLNSIVLSGNRPSVATPCADRNSRSLPCQPLPAAGMHQASQATPRKLSQKPADSTASGSKASMTIAASASASTTRTGRRHSRATTTTAIISAVRTVGSAMPDSRV